MNCAQTHETSISSENKSQTSNCPLHLIKGSIKNICRYSDINIQSKHAIEYSCSLCRNTGKFKALVYLVNGCNDLTTSYCNAVTSLTLTYVTPLTISYTVKILYIICEGHDGCFQSPLSDNRIADACSRITVGLRIIQCLYGDKLLEQGFGRRTFQMLECLPFYSQLSVDVAKGMDENSLWNYFAREVISVEKSDRAKFIGFIGCTEFLGIFDGNYSYENIRLKTLANTALGGGDFALFGTGCLYTWPKSLTEAMSCFESLKPVEMQYYLDDSNSRKTWGGCFATTLGSVCHEIGHVFELGHSLQGIMGNGFDFVNRVFTVSNQTLDLPDRVTNKVCTSNNKTNDPRLTKLNSTNKFLNLFHAQKGNDLTYFERNSAITLAYHKWFNQNLDMPSGVIELNDETGVIASERYPIRLIEMRGKDNALMQTFYSFLDENHLEFFIPENISKAPYDIFVVDDAGNIGKFSF